jgi:Protein of unknown function (DUF4232)
VGATTGAIIRAAFLAALAIAPAPTSASPAATSHLRNCAASQLTVRVVRWALGTTHTGGYIAFVNHGRASCRLRGWPTLVAETAAGATTVARRVRSTWYGPYVRGVPVVTLRHGQAAEAAFSGSDRPPAGAATCPEAFRYLRVTPPGASRSPRVSAWFPPLGRYLPRCGPILVSMVVPPSAFAR